MSRDLVFEIGVEELPSSYVPPALEQLEREAREGLDALRLSFASVKSYGTPRRLALEVKGLADRQPDHEEEAVGPATRVAFDAEGKPTKALLGFCAGKGVAPDAVRTVKTSKGEYVSVTVKHVGQPAIDVLPALLGAIAPRLQFPKSMRWLSDGDVRFARPVRWLLCLLGDDVVPVRAFGLEAGRTTFGHRFLARDAFDVARAADYASALMGVSVVVDHAERQSRLAVQVDRAAKSAGGRVVDDAELLEINNFLVEWSTAFAGAFDRRYLDLPREVIVTALREHQRFFAVEDEKGALLPAFVAVRNGDDQGLARVLEGNQDVLIARLEDARFYWETDLKHAPAARVEALKDVVWMEGLGSLREKATRLEALSGWLAGRLAPEAGAAVTRAALLCKTDLLSEMIGSGKEYASLEGVMGGHYARRAGEPEAVAVAIAEHYRPRGPRDLMPQSDAGAILSLADKLDHVAGAFAAGKLPSGSEDPYGVRRAGNGVIRVLVEQERALDLFAATMQSTAPFFAANPELSQATVMKQLGEFWRGRVEAALDERGVPYDARDAALEARIVPPGADAAAPRRAGWTNPSDALERARTLDGFRKDERFESLAILFRRVDNILRAAQETLPASLDRNRLTEPAEKELAAALDRARERTQPLWQRRAYAEIIPALLEMEGAIHGFFEHVLVNAEDLALRGNRLRLLSEVRESFVQGWDLAKIVVAGAPAGARV